MTGSFPQEPLLLVPGILAGPEMAWLVLQRLVAIHQTHFPFFLGTQRVYLWPTACEWMFTPEVHRWFNIIKSSMLFINIKR